MRPSAIERNKKCFVSVFVVFIVCSWIPVAHGACDLFKLEKAAVDDAHDQFNRRSVLSSVTLGSDEPLRIWNRVARYCESPQTGGRVAVRITAGGLRRLADSIQLGLNYEIQPDCSVKLVRIENKTGKAYASVCDEL